MRPEARLLQCESSSVPYSLSLFRCFYFFFKLLPPDAVLIVNFVALLTNGNPLSTYLHGFL